jgi:hypothetical protein
MFNSKKLKKVIQQQELLDAKVNLLSHSQKTLSEDLEVHFKRMRQTIFASIEDLSSELEEKINSMNKSLEKISQRKDKDAEPCVQEPSKSPIMDKMRFTQLDEDEILEGLGCPIPPLTKGARVESQSNPKRTRQSRLPIDSRNTFFVSVKLPEGVLNYLHNRSANKSVSTTCRNVFEREGKLVFAPVSYEITKNFRHSKSKVITIQISKSSYLAMRKIANELEVTITNVANNFIATQDTAESLQIAMSYSKFNSKDLQYKSKSKK